MSREEMLAEELGWTDPVPGEGDVPRCTCGRPATEGVRVADRPACGVCRERGLDARDDEHETEGEEA